MIEPPMDETDATGELEALRKENAVLRETLDAIDGTVVVYDADRRFVLANQAYHRFFPHLPPSEALAGKRYEDILALSIAADTPVDALARTDPVAYIRERTRAIEEQDAIPREVFDHRRGRWFMIRVQRTPSNARVALRVEITDQKRMQEELRRAQEQAEAASQAKSRFLASISHELRTPLNAVINFARLIEEEIHGELGAPEYREYAATIRQSGAGLLALIEEVLAYVRAESGQVALDEPPVNLRAMLRSICRGAAPRAAAGKVSVTMTAAADLPSVRADQTRLRQALQSLLDRAIDVTPVGGTVDIETGTAADGSVRIAFLDGGPAVRAAEAMQAVEPFADAGQPGLGVRLPLADRIVALHGGQVRFDPLSPAGTRVEVTLPAARVLGDV